MARLNEKNKETNKRKTKNYIYYNWSSSWVFLIYNLFLSPYQQCVRGYVDMKYDKERMKHYPKAEQRKSKNYHKSRAKVQCKALGR